ncbi:MAG: cytochrome c [Bacteroidetes bacterium]|jgi:mono/diheme cytochrome c family protein|nr:cytochrome c [Bacteroidota bacterium]MDA0937109.1 cytochrome c [Bacteroidota bacterium]
MKLLFAWIFVVALLQGVALYQDKPLEKSIADGEEIYQDFCLQCHLDSGDGVSGVFPPLAKSDYLLNNIDLSIKGIKYGLSGPIVVNGEKYDGLMQNQGLENQEIADVMNYILNNWGNQSDEIITSDRVAAVKE